MLARQTHRVNTLQHHLVGAASLPESRARYPVEMAKSGGSALGDWVRALRKKERVGQAVAADGIGISRTHLSNIERGRDSPGRETLLAIATYYKASVDQFMSPTREMTPAKPEEILELAIRFLGPQNLDPARYARRVTLIHKALQEAQREGKTVTAETVPGILVDALERLPDG